MKKRITSVLLALCLLLPMLPVTARAATIVGEGYCGSNVRWSLDDAGVLRISGAGAMTDYTSAVSAPWASKRKSICSVVIGLGVTRIGNCAFYGCVGLTGVDIPDGMTSIGDYAFYGCSGLNCDINIPKSVTSIGAGVFSRTSVSSIQVDDDNLYYSSENGVLFTEDKTTLVAYPGGKTENDYSIPDSVTSIGNSAFSFCSGLTRVEIPDGVTSIGDSAFNGCRGLSSINIPERVTTIEPGVFSGCSSLTSVEIPDGVTSIGDNAFNGCSGLNCDINIPGSVTSIGEKAFYECSGLNCDINIPESVTSIGDQAFSRAKVSSFDVHPDNQCYSSENGVLFTEDKTTLLAYPSKKSGNYYTIPDTVTSIEEYAFLECIDLTGVDIPGSVISIGEYAFWDCRSLTSVDIPGSVISIGEYAFWDCRSLTSVVINEGVTSIGEHAFCGCAGLTSVTIPGSVTSIGDYAFCGCSSLASVEIPDGVTSIGDYAFSGCIGLESVVIPESVTSIGKYAFYECRGLTRVVISEGVTSIGSYAFCGCSSLTDVNYGGSRKKWETINRATTGNVPLMEATIHYAKYDIEVSVKPDGGGTVSVDSEHSSTVIVSMSGGGVYERGDHVTITPAANAGYKFKAWTENSNQVYAVDGDTNVITVDIPDDITVDNGRELVAEFTKTEHTVIFNVNDSTVDSQTVSDGCNADKPEVLNPDYCFLDGWYTENTFETKWDFGEDVVTKDIILYAKWIVEHTEKVVPGKAATCTETGLTDGSKCSVCGTFIKKQEVIPTTSHKEEVIYGNAATCTETGLTDGITCSVCGTVITKQEKIPAKGHTEVTISGKDPTCTETGLKDGLKCSVCDKVIMAQEKIPAKGHSYGEWVTTTEPTDTKDGIKERTCASCGDKETETVPATGGGTIDPDEPKGFTITFDANGGTVDSQETTTGTTGTDGTLSALPSNPTRSGYTFDNWYTAQTGGELVTTSMVFEKDTTVYARWTADTPPAPVEYTVIFDLNYTGSTGAPDTQTVTSGGKAALPDPTPTRTGYTFIGWYKEQACTNAWNFDTDTVTENTTLYAKWEEDGGTATHYSISISNSIAGGSVYVSHSSAAEGTRITIELSPRSGYELDWLSAVNLDTERELSLTRRNDDEYTFIMPSGSVEIDASFYARSTSSGSWYVSENTLARNKPIRWSYKNGQIRHVTDGLVSSGTPFTRDMLISVLYNMDPSSTGEPAFWATKNNIMPDIYQSGLWGTDKSISREQTAMILYCYSQHMGYNLSPNADLTGYADYEQMRPIARTAMSWAQATGLITGNSSNMLSPKRTLTCGEANTILSRFVSMVA